MTALPPPLAVDAWTDTRETFHRWLQIIGKYRMAFAPAVNHWWHVPLYVSTRGLTTGAVPFAGGAWDAEFDVVASELVLRTTAGGREVVPLQPMTVADFFAASRIALERLGVHARISAGPNEVEDATPFALDTHHRSYDPAAVRAFWAQLVFAERVLQRFRSGFIGKSSPVHFFWGAMDLAVTRFSGRGAPQHPGGAPNCPDHVMHEGYSHELSSAGFWPGGGVEGAFYSYAYPAPSGFAGARVPEGAFFDEGLGEFLLPLERVREGADPEARVLEFLAATYEAARTGARWPEGLTRTIS